MDFKDFCEQEIKQDIKSESFKTNSSSQENIKKKAQDSMNRYANLSQQELMEELIRQTNEKKKDGSLSQEKIEQMYQTIYNILPPENRQNLDNIFNKLRW